MTLQQRLNGLHVLIGSSGWFISGSAANPVIISPTDIDVYFYDKKVYEKALQNLHHLTSSWFVNTTKYAYTIDTPHLDLPLQLICKYFGTPEEIFKTMDLNVCKQAVLPNGTHIQDPTAKLPLRIDSVNTSTFDRYLKYYYRYTKPIEEKGCLDNPIKFLLDTYIQDSTLIEDYYVESAKSPINYQLFRTIKTFSKTEALTEATYSYALNQIEILAPELLFYR